jgi:hypothetical protein
MTPNTKNCLFLIDIVFPQDRRDGVRAPILDRIGYSSDRRAAQRSPAPVR